jgi:hypothetical protein
LREWGVYVDLAFFLGGVDEGPVLEAFNPHIFFDDQDMHVESASERVPTGKVLYCSDSTLRAPQAERDEGSERRPRRRRHGGRKPSSGGAATGTTRQFFC